MTQRFNFFDIYAYLIPGLVFLGLLWGPFHLAGKALPSGGIPLGGAIVLGYITGHLLRPFVRVVFALTRDGHYPTAIVLGEGKGSLPPELQRLLEKRFRLRFGFALRRNLGEGFFLCRSALLEKDRASYAEQFQGLYELLRSLVAVGMMSFCYYAGCLAGAWANSHGQVSCLTAILLVLGLTVIVFSLLPDRSPFSGEVPKEDEKDTWLNRYAIRVAFGALCMMLLVLGFHLASAQEFHQELADSKLYILSALFVLALASAHFWRASQFFARDFAVTVYRDFCALS